MPDLPRPVTNDQHYFARLCELIAEQNDLLRQTVTGRQGVDTEPAPPAEPTGPQPVELREPDPPTVPAPPAVHNPPRRPAGRRTAKKGT
jgi:hypothetical protein